MILGHESAGVVVKVGAGVTNLKEGDRVAIEPGIPCSKPECLHCRSGRYNLCPNVRFSATPPTHGTLQRYIVHPAAWLHPLTPEIDYELGAMLEPLSVALAALDRVPAVPGTPMLICGAGPIGLIVLLTAKAMGFGPIGITDVDEARLKVAKDIGANLTYKVPMSGKKPKEIATEVMAEFEKLNASGRKGEARPRVTIECTGVNSSVCTGIYSTQDGGVVMVVGVGPNEQTVPFMDLSMREIDLRFLFRYKDTWPRAIRLIQSNEHFRLDLQKLITQRFPLEDAMKAFETAAGRAPGVVKVQILG